MLIPFAWITEAKLIFNDTLMQRGAAQREARIQSEQSSAEADQNNSKE